MSRYFKDFAYDHVLDARGVLCTRIKEHIDRHFGGHTYKEIGEEVHTSGTTIGNIYNGHYLRLSLVMLTLVAMRMGIDHRV